MKKIVKWGCICIAMMFSTGYAETELAETPATTSVELSTGEADAVGGVKMQYIMQVNDDPTNSQAWFNLAHAEGLEGEVEEAAESLTYYWEFSDDQIQATAMLNTLAENRELEFMSEAAIIAISMLGLK